MLKKNVFLAGTLAIIALAIGGGLLVLANRQAAAGSTAVLSGVATPTPRAARSNVNRPPRGWTDGGVESVDNWMTNAVRSSQCSIVDDAVAKRECIGPNNVAKNQNVSFERTITDPFGATRRLVISKVEKFKTPGFRYFATIDGERRQITYALLSGVGRGEAAAIVSVDGPKATQSIYLPVHRNAQGKVITGMMAGSKQISVGETELGRTKVNMAIWKDDADPLSLTLLAAAPFFIADLAPGRVFGQGAFSFLIGGSSEETVYSLVPSVSARFNCGGSRRTKWHCKVGCAPTLEPRSDASWDTSLFGSGRRRRECAASPGCSMCGGQCCKADQCSSTTDDSLGCDLGISLGG